MPGWLPVAQYIHRDLPTAALIHHGNIVFLWSLMTGLCSVAASFKSLFLARMGVGVGEATLAPAAHSTIADYFPRERLGTALSIYAMGIFIGSGAAPFVGGSFCRAATGLAV